MHKLKQVRKYTSNNKHFNAQANKEQITLRAKQTLYATTLPKD